jgi:hypothetical protein
MKPITASFLAILGFAAGSVSAQVAHVSTVNTNVVPSFDRILPLTQAPVEWNAPDYTAASVEYLIYVGVYYSTSQFGQYPQPTPWQDVPLNLNSRVAASGQGTRGIYLYFAANNTIYTWDANTQQVLRAPGLSVPARAVSSLAVNKREDVLSGFAEGR